VRAFFNEVLASLSGLVPVDHKSPWMSLFAAHTVDAVAEEPVRRRGDVFALAALLQRPQANRWRVQKLIKGAAALTK